MGIEVCRIIDFPKIEDSRANLTFVEGGTKCRLIFAVSTVSTMSQEDQHADLARVTGKRDRARF
jgi:hypothetical protein